MFDSLRFRRRLADTRSLLEEERRLLRRGDIDALAKLNDHRASLLTALLDIPGDFLQNHEEDVKTIRRLAKRNSRLLAAYLDGARRAAARLMEIEAHNGELGVYKADGSRLDGRKTKGALGQRV